MIKTLRVNYGDKIKDLELISFTELPTERQSVDFKVGEWSLEYYYRHATLAMHNCLVNPNRWREVEELTADEFAEFYSHWILASIVQHRMMELDEQRREEKSMSFFEKLKALFGIKPKAKPVAPKATTPTTTPVVEKKQTAPATATAKKTPAESPTLTKVKAAAKEMEEATRKAQAEAKKSPAKATPKTTATKKVEAEKKTAPKRATRPAAKTVQPPKPNSKDEYKRPAKLKADAKDGDGDGLVQDGTIHERKVGTPAKKAPAKKAPAKKSATPAAKKPSTPKKK